MMAEEDIAAMKPIADFIKGNFKIVRKVVDDLYVVKYAATSEHVTIFECFKSLRLHDRKTPAREQVEINKIYLVKQITDVYARGVVISVDDEVLYRIWYIDEDKYDVVSLGRIKVADGFDKIYPIYQLGELKLEPVLKDPATVFSEYGPTFEEEEDDNDSRLFFEARAEVNACIPGPSSSNNDVPPSAPSSSSLDGPKSLKALSAKNQSPAVIDLNISSSVPANASTLNDVARDTIEVIHKEYEDVTEDEFTSAELSSSSMTSSTEELPTSEELPTFSSNEYTDPDCSLYVQLI